MQKPRLLGFAFCLVFGAAVLTACQQTPTSPKTSTPAESSATQATALTVSIQNMSFSPTPLTVKVGQSVTWTNNDPTEHDVASDTGEFSSPRLNKGDSYTYTFTKAGTFAYHCNFHPFMKATIVVVE